MTDLPCCRNPLDLYLHTYETCRKAASRKAGFLVIAGSASNKLPEPMLIRDTPIQITNVTLDCDMYMT
jgi:hypothetical protein